MEENQKCPFFLFRFFYRIYLALLKLHYHWTLPRDILQEERVNEGHPFCPHQFFLIPWDTGRYGPPRFELIDENWPRQPGFILFENLYRCTCGAKIIRTRRVKLP